MADESRTYSRKTENEGGSILPALCNVVGTLLLVAVIALCIPLTVPVVAGYQVFEVVSGSMEPEIPVGSVVYVKQVEPSTLKVGDVVAYQDESGVVVHRVTTNRTSIGELVTKGDANNVEDFSPIPYNAVLGRAEVHIPYVGTFMSIYSTMAGKVYLLLVAACGVMLNMVGASMRKRKREAAAAQTERELSILYYAGEDGGIDSVPSALQDSMAEKMAARKRSRVGSIVRKVIVVVLLVVFLGSGGFIAFTYWQYGISDARYSEAVNDYAEANGGSNKVPITVDFKSLQAKYPKVVGWLYCEGTPINYPVMQTIDNDYYLTHDYMDDFNINGAIFVDKADRLAVDSKAVIYGHHMKSGSMFASLLDWSSQDFYDKHPVMWLLTPEQNYKVELFSGHHVNAYSNLYSVVHEPGDELNAYLASAQELSDFKSDVKLDKQAHYVMLSTCAYLFDDDRYVLHGMLTPVM